MMTPYTTIITRPQNGRIDQATNHATMPITAMTMAGTRPAQPAQHHDPGDELHDGHGEEDPAPCLQVGDDELAGVEQLTRFEHRDRGDGVEDGGDEKKMPAKWIPPTPWPLWCSLTRSPWLATL